MRVEDYNYDLPQELIAQTPLKDRSSSKLLVLDKLTGKIEDKHFFDIIDSDSSGDCFGALEMGKSHDQRLQLVWQGHHCPDHSGFGGDHRGNPDGLCADPRAGIHRGGLSDSRHHRHCAGWCVSVGVCADQAAEKAPFEAGKAAGRE